MEIPSTLAGTIGQVCIEVGATVSEGDLIVRLEVAEEAGDGNEAVEREPVAAETPDSTQARESEPSPSASETTLPNADSSADVVVPGAAILRIVRGCVALDVRGENDPEKLKQALDAFESLLLLSPTNGGGS